MDVSKFHTKYPPREHEEAVRMLLEGLEPKQVTQSDLSKPQAANPTRSSRHATSASGGNINMRDRTPSRPRQQEPRASAQASKFQQHHQRHRAHESPASSIDSGSLAQGAASGEEEEDDDDDEPEREFEFARGGQRRPALVAAAGDQQQLEFNSEESSSREFSIQVSPQIPSKRNHVTSSPGPRMQSQGTSTASDSISTSGASSSGGRGLAQAQEAAAATNIEYEAVPSRTIAIQCDLKLSSVKRDGYLDSASTDLASMQASSISSTRYGFYRLSPETLERRRQLARSVSSRNIAAAPPLRANVAEAPTSMSELSSDEDEREIEQVGGFDRELAAVVRGKALAPLSVQSAMPDDERSLASGDFRTRRKDERLLNQRPAMHRDSLPRRPKTALSYVSTSRLRAEQESLPGDQTPDKSLSDHEQQDRGAHEERGQSFSSRRMTPRSRAMSQQVLSGQYQYQATQASRAQRPPVSSRATTEELSNSEGELSATAPERFRLPQREEIAVVATKRGRPGMGASPQVRRSNNIRNGPLLRRYATMTIAPAAALAPPSTRVAASNREANLVDVSSRQQHARQQQVSTSSKEDDGSGRQSNHSASQRRPMVTSKVNSGTSYTTTTTTEDEENQLETGDRRRPRATALLGDQQAKGARFSSMSLSRGRQPQLIDQARGSCNLIDPSARAATTGSISATRTQPTDDTTASTTAFEPAYQQQQHQHQQQHHQRSTLARAPDRFNHVARPASRATGNTHIGRSASMKHTAGRTARLAVDGDYQQPEGSTVYTVPTGPGHRQRHYYDPAAQCEYDDCCGPVGAGDDCYAPEGAGAQELRPARNWANPSSARRQASHHQSVYNLTNQDGSSAEYTNAKPAGNHRQGSARPLSRKSARSHSMRDVNQLGDAIAAARPAATNPLLGHRPRRFESIYRAGQQELDNEEEEAEEEQDLDLNGTPEEVSVCSTASINGATREVLTRAQAHHQPLDFDSQQRLNEIGLPEPGHAVQSSPSTKRASASHLGLSGGLASVANRYATTGRHNSSALVGSHQPGPALITGRAMSQQSLTRPTMPLSRRLRRSGGGGGVSAGSGSDVGGSSMSLVSRLRDGSRYENAHTRTPVVMLIPQASATSKQDLTRSEVNSRRASSRLGRPLGKTSGSRVSSQDRSHRRSVSRNNSDSESSSSMLRTLVKPRANSRMGPANRSARRKPLHGATRDDSDPEENMDGVGQLATEIDSYKFRRRYSVPKDAKINWFSKLKQRVTSKS